MKTKHLRKLLVFIIVAALSGVVNAAYMIHIPTEVSLGGALPNGSIVFNNQVEQPTEPSTPIDTPIMDVQSNYQKITDYSQTSSLGLYANSGDTKPFAAQLTSKIGDPLNNQFNVNVANDEELYNSKKIIVNGVSCDIDIRRNPGAPLSRSVGCSNKILVTNTGGNISVKLTK